jgi:hypothetical protein
MAVETAVRFIDTNRKDEARLGGAITGIYNGDLDVVIVREAFSRDLVAGLAKTLDRPDASETWFRPNAVVPTEDIYILGTDTPATPTCKAPSGASLEAYLESASKHETSARNALGNAVDAETEIRSLLEKMSDGRNVELAVAADGRRYVPYTLRLLKEGKQISVHHDYHYPLGLYNDLSQRLDTRTLISFLLVLQRPDNGGALIVYGLNSDDPKQPMLPNGRWDLQAIEERYDRARFDLLPGDFALLASGRRFHRVEPVAGPHARITLGGFLALDKAQQRVLFWS